MKPMYRSLPAAIFVLEAIVSVAPALAQADAPEEDGSGRGVARISLLNGDVTVRRGDSGDWVAAAVNAPLLAEDRVLTGVNSRAEVQLDYYNRIRLAGDTEIRFAELEWHKYQIQIAHGTAIFAALPGTDDQIEFATPAGSLRPLAPGSYRMTVSDDGRVEFTVRQGEAEIYTPRGSRHLTPGRTMWLHLSQDIIPAFQFAREAPRDAFDEFSDSRDQELQNTKSYQYVSRDVYGAEDLDGAGEWTYQAPYGWSWRPYVAPDWAPYREGHWAWIDDSYGWTWISYDPWGWAPYHYGRWFCNAGAWFWYPGPLIGRHIWRPGLVAFFGYGGFGAGFGFGGFGWVPLAPFETYHPWYGQHRYGGGGYRVANVAAMYRNARVHNAVSGVNAGDFGRGGGSVRPVGANELGRASVMRGALPVTPGRESLRMSDRPVGAALAARAARSGNERFVAAHAAPPSNRVPFESLNRSPQSTPRGGFSRSGGAERNANRGEEAGAAAENGRAASQQGGWRRSGGESNTWNGRGSANANSPSSSGSTRGGWGSFGVPSTSRSSAGSASTSQRGGWTSFGSPERRGSTGGQFGRGGWSTGSGSASEPGYRRGSNPNSGGSYGRGDAPYRGPNSGSGGWDSRSEAPARGQGSGGGAPHYSAPSGGSAPRYSAPSGGGGSRSSAPARSGGGGGGGSRGGGGGGHSPRR